MTTAALAAIPAAPHPQPHTAAARVRPRDGGLTVRVPLRLVVGAQYPDAALSVYVKVAALALRPEGCTARVATLATYLGLSKSAVERGLRPLTQPDPIDGLTEIPTVRRTQPGGTGESAHRMTRPLTDGELWVRIPVRAAEALTPRLLRLYALLAYATARRIPVTVSELGEMLRHHTGQRAGESLGERQARRLVDQLEETGWLAVHRREGARGRHAYEPRRHPLHPVPAPATAVPEGAALEDRQPEQLPLWQGESPVNHDGSGADLDDGSLASEEDHVIDGPVETKAVGVSRRRRRDRKWVPEPAGNAAAPVPDTFRPGTSRAPRGNHLAPAIPSSPYAGPELRWTQRIHDSLAPARHLLNERVSRFMLRRVAREIGRQLDNVAHNLMTPERMAARITARYRDARTIRDVGAWLLHVAIVPQGCGLPLCEDGRTWPTGEPCETCAQKRQITSEQWRHARAWDERLAEVRAERVLEKATYRQRSAAMDAEVLAVAAEHGPAAALHRYGVLRAGQLLRAAYGALPELPAAAPRPAPTVPVPRAIKEAPMRDDYMPAAFRAAIGRPALTGALTIACPAPGCLADEGQPCTTPRGRRRTTPHTARAAVAQLREEES
ncbi:zinc finger domain-containing protein [Streptomyces sediminimaris]|uniref:zinc finger domain-containing protein n=1 Tax=Streptomyces sediminimaris TaxID=3383721 RepID=UPI00399BF4EB